MEPTDRRATELAELAETLMSVSRRISLLGAHDTEVLHLSQIEALLIRHIDDHPGRTPSQLADRLGIKASNASTALHSLEAKHLIRREVDPADGRCVRIFTTAAAPTLRVARRWSWARLLDDVVDGDQDLTATLALLQSMDERLGEAGPRDLAHRS